MDENLHNIENLFRDSLEDNEDIPSENVWNGIDQTLDKDNVVSIKKKYTTMKRVAVILLLMVLSFSVYELRNSHTNQGLTKKDQNILNNQAFTKRNNGQSSLPTIIQSKNLDDSINPKVKGKNNEHPDNLIEKTAAVNKLPAKTDNNTIAEKEITIDLKTNSSTKKDNLVKNENIKNTKLYKNISSNKILLDNKLKKNYTSGINNSTAVENIFSSKNKQKYSNKKVFHVTISSAAKTDNEQIVLVNRDVDKTYLKSTLKKRSNDAVDKIKIERDSVELKNLFHSLSVNNLQLPLNIKDFIATKTKKKIVKPSRFSITPFFSSDIAWYRLQEDKPDNQPDNLAEIEKSEKHEFSSTKGILIDYKLNKKWSLQSGFTYSNTNITVEPKTIYAQSDNAGNVKYRINTSSGYGFVLPSFSSNPTVGDSLFAFTSTHTLNYVGIPIAIKYNISKGKFSFSALAGLSTNILTSGKIETLLEKGFNNETEVVDNLRGLKKIYFSGLAGIGVDYILNKKMALSFAPTYRFALNSINQDAPVKSYPNSIGFSLGLKIGL